MPRNSGPPPRPGYRKSSAGGRGRHRNGNRYPEPHSELRLSLAAVWPIHAHSAKAKSERERRRWSSRRWHPIRHPTGKNRNGWGRPSAGPNPCGDEQRFPVLCAAKSARPRPSLAPFRSGPRDLGPLSLRLPNRGEPVPLCLVLSEIATGESSVRICFLQKLDQFFSHLTPQVPGSAGVTSID